MKKLTKIKNAIKRKVNESRLRRSVQSILHNTLPNILAEIDQLDQAFLDAKPVKELDVRKTHGDKRIENPATGNDIKLRTALKAKKGSAVYAKGKAMYNALKDTPTNEGKINERFIVTRNAWNRMSDDEKIDALQTAYEDPDEAMKHYEKKWEDLPSVATQNMYKEGKLNESMIGIKTKANFKPLRLKGALERAGIKGYQMNRLSVTLTALKVDKKDFNNAKKIIDALGLSVMMAKESVNEYGGSDFSKITSLQNFLTIDLDKFERGLKNSKHKAAYKKARKQFMKAVSDIAWEHSKLYEGKLTEDYSQRARNFRVALRRRLEAMKSGQKVRIDKLVFTKDGNNFKTSKGRTVPSEEVVQAIQKGPAAIMIRQNSARSPMGDPQVNAYLKFEGKLNEASKSQVTKAFSDISKLSVAMLLNIKKFKAAKAKGDEKAIEKHRKIAYDLQNRKKKMEADLDKMITGIDKDVELAMDERAYASTDGKPYFDYDPGQGKLNERYTFEFDPTDSRFHKEFEHFLAELLKAIKGSKNPKAKSLAGKVKAAQGLAKKFTDIVGVRGGHSGGALGRNEGKLTERFDYDKVRDVIESEFGWNYVESEGPNETRFDFRGGSDSMWISSKGKYRGNVPNNPGLKRAMKKLGIVKEIQIPGSVLSKAGEAAADATNTAVKAVQNENFVDYFLDRDNNRKQNVKFWNAIESGKVGKIDKANVIRLARKFGVDTKDAIKFVREMFTTKLENLQFINTMVKTGDAK